MESHEWKKKMHFTVKHAGNLTHDCHNTENQCLLWE